MSSKTISESGLRSAASKKGLSLRQADNGWGLVDTASNRWVSDPRFGLTDEEAHSWILSHTPEGMWWELTHSERSPDGYKERMVQDHAHDWETAGCYVFGSLHHCVDPGEGKDYTEVRQSALMAMSITDNHGIRHRLEARLVAKPNYS